MGPDQNLIKFAWRVAPGAGLPAEELLFCGNNCVQSSVFVHFLKDWIHSRFTGCFTIFECFIHHISLIPFLCDLCRRNFLRISTFPISNPVLCQAVSQFHVTLVQALGCQAKTSRGMYVRYNVHDNMNSIEVKMTAYVMDFTWFHEYVWMIYLIFIHQYPFTVYTVRTAYFNMMVLTAMLRLRPEGTSFQKLQPV